MQAGFDIAVLAVVSACLLAWGLVSARLERFNVSPPMAFVALGLLASHGPWSVVHLQVQSSTMRSIAEITLALVLFSDASRVNLRTMRSGATVPLRLLGIGLPLTIALGAGVAVVLFAGTGGWVAAAIGAIVAPTDAALGASLLVDERIPLGVRRSLNIESGLNDGIATPFVNVFLAGALTAEAVAHHPTIGSALVELLGGAAWGVLFGGAGALLIVAARKARWSEAGFRPLSVLALVLLAYSTALAIGVNGFIAAFVGGLAFGTVLPGHDELLAFSEEAGTLMSLFVWFLFGAVMLVPGLQAVGWRDVVFVVLALTVVRMVPVAVALTGSRLDRSTVAFIGWFGPRGLASVVFGLLALDSLDPADGKRVFAAVTLTVLVSVLAHGLSAAPLARRYAAHVTAAADHPPSYGAAGQSEVRARGLTLEWTQRRRSRPVGGAPGTSGRSGTSQAHDPSE